MRKHYTAKAGLAPERFDVMAKMFDIVPSAIAAPILPSTTDERLLLSDWSHFQGEVDILKHLAYGPPKFRGVVIRSGQGKNTSYDDLQFANSAHKCEANDFPWMLYHVYIPAQDAEAQVVHLMNLIDGLGGPLPKWIWWDVEVHNNKTKRHISNGTIHCVERTKQLSSIDTGVYSGKWFTDGYMETQYWFAEIVWWIAQWIKDQPSEHPWPNALPATVGIEQVMMHQTTSNANGRLCGVSSTRLDLDRWMWTVEKFNEIMGNGEEPPPDTHEELWAFVLKNAGDIENIEGRLEAVKKAL